MCVELSMDFAKCWILLMLSIQQQNYVNQYCHSSTCYITAIPVYPKHLSLQYILMLFHSSTSYITAPSVHHALLPLQYILH